MASKRAKSSKPKQPTVNEQSGSTGRRAAGGRQPAGRHTGQDHYGQSGYAGVTRETDGQAKYRRSATRGNPASKSRSNHGSGKE